MMVIHRQVILPDVVLSVQVETHLPLVDLDLLVDFLEAEVPEAEEEPL
jgi:hypothetical protein